MYHRWHANSDALIKPYGLHDKCLSCGVHRYDPGAGDRALRSNAVAAGPCPQKPWRELPEETIATLIEEYQS